MDPKSYSYKPPTTPTPIPTLPPKGATLPYDEYEAEDAAYAGTLLGPSRSFGNVAAESSQRKAVQLNASGDYVRFTAQKPFNSIVVRYVIPDAPGGGGINATLSLYIGGVHVQDLDLTSKYSWIYGGSADSSTNNPAVGGAHHFYDEVRALLGSYPSGTTVTLQRDPGDSAAYYVIDLIDLEQVAPPLGMPANFLSITDYGAVAGDGGDDRQAIKDCFDAAKAQGKGVWLPAGTFDVSSPNAVSGGVEVDEVTFRGAGMWHTTVRGTYARFKCVGNNCRFYDFSVLGETVTRIDSNPENAFNGRAGTGSRLENVWVEHTKVGWWVGSTSSGQPTDGLVVRGCRFRNLFADGVNFCNGASNSVIEQCHARNTGDDAFASWSPTSSGGVNTNNVFRFNTIQSPWRANCLAIYGGQDNKIQDNLCLDTVTYPGIYLSQEFSSWPFAGTTRVERNDLIRAGGLMWGKQYGALKIQALDSSMAGFSVSDIRIVAPTYSGVQFEGSNAINSASLSNILVQDAATHGIEVRPGTDGSATFSFTTVVNSAVTPMSNFAPATFTLIQGGGNVGW